MGVGFAGTQLSLVWPVPDPPVQLLPEHPDHVAQWPLVHWLSFVHQQCAFDGSSAPLEQLALHVGSVSATQWSAACPVPEPVQLLPEQPDHVAHLPLAHWLSLVHQQYVLLGSSAPVEHELADGVHVKLSAMHPSDPPAPDAPLQAPEAHPDQVAQWPLAHWLSAVHSHDECDALHAPIEHE